MYSIENIIADCIGRYLYHDSKQNNTSRPHKGDTPRIFSTNIISSSTYAKLYSLYIYHITVQHVHHTQNIQLFNIGTIQFDNITHQPVLCVYQSYLQQHRLTINQSSHSIATNRKYNSVEHNGYIDSYIHCNYTMLSQQSHCTTQVCKTALQHISMRLTEVLHNKLQLLLDCGIGTLTSDNGQLNFIIHDNKQPLELLSDTVSYTFQQG